MAREGELGALWRKQGRSGEFFSGHILVNGVKTPIVVFPKREKKNDKQPDFDILLSKPREGAEEKQGYERHDVAAPAAGAVQVDPDDIPF